MIKIIFQTHLKKHMFCIFSINSVTLIYKLVWTSGTLKYPKLQTTKLFKGIFPAKFVGVLVNIERMPQ